MIAEKKKIRPIIIQIIGLINLKHFPNQKGISNKKTKGIKYLPDIPRIVGEDNGVFDTKNRAKITKIFNKPVKKIIIFCLRDNIILLFSVNNVSIIASGYKK